MSLSYHPVEEQLEAPDVTMIGEVYHPSKLLQVYAGNFFNEMNQSSEWAHIPTTIRLLVHSIKSVFPSMKEQVNYNIRK